MPTLLAMFFWHGMLAFFAALGDLREKPWLGVLMWGTAVLLLWQKVSDYVAMNEGPRVGIVFDPLVDIARASFIALFAAACIIAPLAVLLGRPWREVWKSWSLGLIL